jgi:hypothetical protein
MAIKIGKRKKSDKYLLFETGFHGSEKRSAPLKNARVTC